MTPRPVDPPTKWLPQVGEEDEGTVTRLLKELDAGNREAMQTLFPLVYDEVRSLAHQQRRAWHGDLTLDTTALVHEAYLKLVGSEHVGARTRVHFFRIAAKAMRHILCSYARERQAEKRGGRHLSSRSTCSVMRSRAKETVS